MLQTIKLCSMSRAGICATVVLSLLLTLFHASPAEAKRYYKKGKYAAIVIDASNGDVLHEVLPEKQLYPASLTKMMTLYMAFDALNSGKLHKNRYLPVSYKAAEQVPSSLGLKKGESIRTEDAILALVTKSANDAAVALAEAIGGSERTFAKMMTAKAKELGMTRTTFKNASGLHDRQQKSTARDMATLSQALIRDHHQYYHYFSTERFKYRGRTYKNHNKLMKTYKGMDGLKTGYIHASGFNLAASAVRDGKRLIGVVFGGRTGKMRNKIMKAALDKGFRKVKQNVRIASAMPLPQRRPNNATQTASRTRIKPITKVASIGIVPVKKPVIAKPAIAKVERPTIQPTIENSESLTLAESIIAHINDYVASADTIDQGDTNLDLDEDVRFSNNWAIQLGSFSRRDTTLKALHSAKEKVASLELATELVVPLKTGRGTFYRARLIGLKLDAAKEACAELKGDCLVLTAN